MDVLAIFALQFIFSIIVISLIMKWTVVPWLNQQTLYIALFWLVLPHMFRHIGMLFLVPDVQVQPLPDSFALPAAYGDLVAAVLAMLACIALRSQWSAAIAVVWVFNVWGTLDLLNALSHGEVVSYFGITWYIPTFLVPLLLVTHYMIFVRLIKNVRKA